MVPMSENNILSEMIYYPDNGALRFKGVRYLLIRPETLASFQNSLEAEAGQEPAAEILYAGGFSGGQLSGRRYKETLGLTDREAVEFMCCMGREIGWGHFYLAMLDIESGRLVVEVDSSPFAEAYKVAIPDQREALDSVCHLIRGVLGGLADGLFGSPVRAREERCLAVGGANCRFEIEFPPVVERKTKAGS